MKKYLASFVAIAAVVCASMIFGPKASAAVSVGSAEEFTKAIEAIAAKKVKDSTINLKKSITVSAAIPSSVKKLTISGNGNTITSAGLNVALDFEGDVDLTLSNIVITGGQKSQGDIGEHGITFNGEKNKLTAKGTVRINGGDKKGASGGNGINIIASRTFEIVGAPEISGGSSSGGMGGSGVYVGNLGTLIINGAAKLQGGNGASGGFGLNAVSIYQSSIVVKDSVSITAGSDEKTVYGVAMFAPFAALTIDAQGATVNAFGRIGIGCNTLDIKSGTLVTKGEGRGFASLSLNSYEHMPARLNVDAKGSLDAIGSSAGIEVGLVMNPERGIDMEALLSPHTLHVKTGPTQNKPGHARK